METVAPKQVVFKNSFWLLVGNLSTRALKFFLFLAAARALGPGPFGVFSLALSSAALVFLAAGIFHSTSVSVRDIAADAEVGEVPGTASVPGTEVLPMSRTSSVTTHLALRSLLALGGLLLAVGVGFFVPSLPITIAVLLAAATAFDFARDGFGALFQSDNRMDKESVILILQGIATAFLGLAFIFLMPSPLSLAAAYAIGSALGFLGMAVFSRSLWGALQIVLDRIAIARMARDSFAFGTLWTLLIASYFPLLQIFLGIVSGPEKVGLFSVPAQIAQIAIVPAMLFAIAALPQMSAGADLERKNRTASLLGATIATVSLPVAVMGILFARPATLFFFGSAYLSSGPLLQIVLLGLPFASFVSIMLYVILARNEFRAYLPAFACALILGYAASAGAFVIFPNLGPAIASLAFYIITAACIAWRFATLNGRFPFLFSEVKVPLVASGAVLGVGLIGIGSGISLWLAAFLCAAAYLVLLRLMRSSVLEIATSLLRDTPLS